jgi:hypothetical protein
MVLPVEERGGLWRLKRESPSRFRERLLELVDAASQLDDELFDLFNQS